MHIFASARRTPLHFLLATLIFGCRIASGDTINFEEFPADNINGSFPSNRYAGLGVTFLGTDDGTTFGGIGNGDPGNWGLLGTNGSIFQGFNGSSYSMTMLFDSAVEDFSLDVSRSNGSSPGNTFTLEGYRNNVLVESIPIVLGAINSWTTLSLTQQVDEVRWFGNGAGFHPFGVDNINFQAAAVPEPASLLAWGLLTGVGLVGYRLRRRKATA